MRSSKFDNKFKREDIALAERAKSEGRSMASVANNLVNCAFYPKKAPHFCRAK